jgi:hypothetical protein
VGSVCSIRTFELFGWSGEDETYHVEKNTQDLLIVNNYYFCRNVEYIQKVDIQYVSGMEELSELVGKTITWRLIHYPVVQLRERDAQSALGREFHRGCCWFIRIKTSNNAKYVGKYNIKRLCTIVSDDRYLYPRGDRAEEIVRKRKKR